MAAIALLFDVLFVIVLCVCFCLVFRTSIALLLLFKGLPVFVFIVWFALLLYVVFVYD